MKIPAREILTKRCYAYETKKVLRLRKSDKRWAPIGCKKENRFEKAEGWTDLELSHFSSNQIVYNNKSDSPADKKARRRDPDKNIKDDYCLLEDGEKCTPGKGYCDYPIGWCVPIFENPWLERQKEEDGTWMNPAIFEPGGTLGPFDPDCPPKCGEQIKWGL